MPLMDGFELQKEIRRSWPNLPSLVLTAYRGEEAKKRMFKLGANGFLSKDCSPEEIVQAIFSIRDRGSYHRSVSDAKLHTLVANESVRVNDYKPRDRDFLRYLWEGLSYQDIALKMNCSESAVRSYRDRLFRKMGVGSREELLRVAVKSGLFEL